MGYPWWLCYTFGMTKQLEEIKARAVPILKEAGVKRSSVFGSYAHGEQRADSDLDLLIEAPDGMGLFEFVHLQSELEKALDKKVDLVTFNSIHPLLKDRILNEQIQIL